jgi:aurora kinase
MSKTTRNKEEKNSPTMAAKGSPLPPPFSLSPTNSKIESKVSIRDFEVGKSKGEGKFGTVYLAKHKLTNSIYALKKIPKQVIKDHHMEDQLVLEIKLQYYMNHPNILKLYTFFEDYENIYLVLEYM